MESSAVLCAVDMRIPDIVGGNSEYDPGVAFSFHWNPVAPEGGVSASIFFYFSIF